jgi:hypothetical protein
MYEVQTGMGKGKYTARYRFETWNQAVRWYNSINAHSGGKKRLINLETGKVEARVITNKYW